MLMNSGTALGRLLAGFLSHAGYGVDIFFTLSGFLICTLLLREKQANGAISLSRFYLRRVFRILPPILLYLAALLGLRVAGLLPQIGYRELGSVLLFARNYIYAGSWYTGHFWSLAVEEHFYLIIPVLLLLLSWRWAMRVAGVLALMCVAIRWIEYSHHLFPGALLQFRTENRIDALFCGGMMALLLEKPTIRAWLRAKLTVATASSIVVGTATLLTLLTSQPERRTIVALAIPFLIAHTVLRPSAILGRVLELRGVRWLGRISYSLYIWQMLFLVGVARQLGPVQSFPLALLCPFLCAMLSYYLVEKPCIRFGHQLTAGLRSSAPAPAIPAPAISDTVVPELERTLA